MDPTTPGGAEPHDLAVFPDGLRGKRILLCTESFGPVNGVSRTTLMLVTHLRAQGVRVAVVAPHNHTKENTFLPSPARPPALAAVAGGPVDGDGQEVEVRVRGYPLPFNPELSIVYPVRLSTLYARTFGGPPDLIYLASPASLGFQVMLQLRQQPPEKQVPLICNFQTDLAGYCAILFPAPLSHLAVLAFAGVQSFLFRHPSVRVVFYPSLFVRRYLERQGIQAEKMDVLRRGVNVELFSPDKRSVALRREIAPDGEIILLCVARLAGEKGFDFLAEVAKEMDARGLRFKLYIVGGNRNAAVEAEIKGMFAPLVEKGRVVFAGFKVGEPLAQAYASADLFLHCSITETFGLVVLESMASGVPVIARDEGGPSDTVDHGVSGFLVPPADLSGFVDQVILLACDAGLRQQFSEKARNQVCDATWGKINNKVAWKMLGAIEERRREVGSSELGSRTGAGSGASSLAAPVFSWLILNDSIRTKMVESRLTAALGIILGFWGAVSVYLIFVKATQWARSRLRW